MKVRSITLGVNWRGENKARLESDVRAFFEKATDLLSRQGADVRTKRLVLPPFAIRESLDNENIGSVVGWMSAFCEACDVRWFCVPFTTLGQDMREVNTVAIEVAKRYKNAFINFIVAADGRLNRQGVYHASKFIKSVSRLSNNGYDNFRVGASFNCEAHGPFFPFTYHAGANGFTMALELVPPFVEVIERHRGESIEVVRTRLVEAIAPLLQRLDAAGRDIEKATGMAYYGIDVSLAPYPDSDDNSVARIIELLGVDGFGSSGTLFLTSYLTDILRELLAVSAIKPAGFNGVMYSLLEDTRLGINNSAKEFSIDSLLAYSTVCGCGVDMVPVPGDIFEEELAAMMIDVAAVSAVLRKPLGVRILPIPAKHAYEFTEFSYDFLHNTRIQKPKNRGCFTEFLDIREPFSYLKERPRHEP